MSVMDTFREAAAVACEDAAVLLIGGDLRHAPETDLTVPCNIDRQTLDTQLGVPEPYSWITTTSLLYMGEAAHELRAIAALLRADILTGSLGPLVRAVVERIGVLRWMLDLEQTDSTERGWRAMLNTLICMKEFRKTIDQLGATSADKKTVADTHRNMRAMTLELFQPQADPNEPKDVAFWSRNDSAYPTLTDLAVIALSGDFSDVINKGVYGAECGMTHPNVVVMTEIMHSTATGVEFRHRAEDVDKQVRVALISFVRGLQTYARYVSTEADFNDLGARVKKVLDDYEVASALVVPRA